MTAEKQDLWSHKLSVHPRMPADLWFSDGTARFQPSAASMQYPLLETPALFSLGCGHSAYLGGTATVLLLQRACNSFPGLCRVSKASVSNLRLLVLGRRLVARHGPAASSCLFFFSRFSSSTRQGFGAGCQQTAALSHLNVCKLG